MKEKIFETALEKNKPFYSEVFKKEKNKKEKREKKKHTSEVIAIENTLQSFPK